MYQKKFLFFLIVFSSFACARNEKKEVDHQKNIEIGGIESDVSDAKKSQEQRTFMLNEEYRKDSILFDKIIKTLKKYPVFTSDNYSSKTEFIYKAVIHLLYESEYLTTEEKIDLIHIIKLCEIDKNRALMTYTTLHVINSDTVIAKQPELYVPMLCRTTGFKFMIDKENLMSKIPPQYKFLYEEYLKDIDEGHCYHAEFLNPRSFYQLGLYQKYNLGLPSSVDEFKEYRKNRMIIH